jgi:hypothetical protein
VLSSTVWNGIDRLSDQAELGIPSGVDTFDRSTEPSLVSRSVTLDTPDIGS